MGVSIMAALLGFYLTGSLIAGAGIMAIALVAGGALRAILNKKRNSAIEDNQLWINETREDYLEAENRMKAIYDMYRVNSVQELEEKKEKYLKTSLSLEHGKEQLKELVDRRKQTEDNGDELHDTIMIYMHRFISEEELTPEAMERLKETICIKKKEVQREQAERNMQLEECRIQIERIRWELSQLEDNESELIKNKEQYTYLMKKEEENNAELAAINLALNTIRELSATIHDSFGMQLNETVSEIIRSVTNHRYQDIKIDEKLTIKLGWRDNYILLDRLSAGTIDQVYFALRLAVADLLMGVNSLPIMLDDSFAFYDDSRIKAAFAQIACRNQVLLFSCQTREKRILEELGLPFNFVRL